MMNNDRGGSSNIRGARGRAESSKTRATVGRIVNARSLFANGVRLRKLGSCGGVPPPGPHMHY
eukprot:2871744-Pyramimonas_sp.AAC.1